MKYFYLKKKDGNFNDVLSDSIIKKNILVKIILDGILILGFRESTGEGILSYFFLKYGEYVVNQEFIITDYTPKPYVDYTPDDPSKH